jgi:membrane carboxypeptidase/penicillin-binding protein
MVRQKIVDEYKEQAYTSGIKVYTTLLKADQDAAYEAVRNNVMAYDQRHGYRGPKPLFSCLTVKMNVTMRLMKCCENILPAINYRQQS